jgi:hypothetical protein
MPEQRSNKKRRVAPKTVLRLPDLDQAKSAVPNSLTSADAQRGYRHAIDEFIEWYCSEPRLSFNRTVVLRYRILLESRKLASGRPWARNAPRSAVLAGVVLAMALLGLVATWIPAQRALSLDPSTLLREV